MFVKIFPYDFKKDGSAIVGIRCKRKIGKRGKNKLKSVCQGVYDFEKNIFTITKGISKCYDKTISKDGYSWYGVLVEALEKHDWSDNICFQNKKGVIWLRKNGMTL